jgi:hypothetical protein
VLTFEQQQKHSILNYRYRVPAYKNILFYKNVKLLYGSASRVINIRNSTTRWIAHVTASASDFCCRALGFGGGGRGGPLEIEVVVERRGGEGGAGRPVGSLMSAVVAAPPT